MTVPVRVIDRKGRFVGGLKKDDFKVFEDGAEQGSAIFKRARTVYGSVVLDMSYSTKFQIADIQTAAISFIDQLGPKDKVMVVSFDENVHMLCEPTNDRGQIYRAIRSTKISTGTSLYEAVDLVMNDRLKRSKEARRSSFSRTESTRQVRGRTTCEISTMPGSSTLLFIRSVSTLIRMFSK